MSIRGRVAIYGTWNVFENIFNERRSGLVDAGRLDAAAGEELRRARATRCCGACTRPPRRSTRRTWTIPSCRSRCSTTSNPRSRGCCSSGYGETDNWAHQGRYDLVLDSAHRTDGFVKELWDTMQAMPQYRGTTTFIITTDHGRGSGLTEWKEHGVEEKGSENIWIAVIGPDTRGARRAARRRPVTQAQIAATVAAFLGKDYHAAVPRAAPPDRGPARIGGRRRPMSPPGWTRQPHPLMTTRDIEAPARRRGSRRLGRAAGFYIIVRIL